MCFLTIRFIFFFWTDFQSTPFWWFTTGCRFVFPARTEPRHSGPSVCVLEHADSFHPCLLLRLHPHVPAPSWAWKPGKQVRWQNGPAVWGSKVDAGLGPRWHGKEECLGGNTSEGSKPLLLAGGRPTIPTVHTQGSVFRWANRLHPAAPALGLPSEPR